MDEEKRLTLNKLKAIAGETGFKEELIEKDYHLTKILYLLKDIEGIYFKGGTALQKIFLNYSRLSEDADYTVTRDIGEVRKEIEDILIESNFFKRITKDKDVDDFLRIVVIYQDFNRKENQVFIDLNKRANLIEKPEVNRIPHFYNDEIPDFAVNTLSREELFAEKMAATIGRNKPRDHFDIYMMIKNGFRINYGLARKKCKQSNSEFDINKIFNKAQKLKNRWDADMLPLLNKEIEFEEVITTLAKHFNLKNKK